MTLGLEVSVAGAQVSRKRPFSLDDVARIRAVSDPAISPDGGWVSYTVTTVDGKRDRRQSDVWMTSWDGSRTVRLSSTPESEAGAKWSPDGRWLAFLSSRDDRHEVAQLSLLDRTGEAELGPRLAAPGRVAQGLVSLPARRLHRDPDGLSVR